MSVVGTIAAAITFFITRSPQAAMWAYSIGSGIEAAMTPGPDGPRLTDLRPQGSEYGRAIPVVYGTVGIGGNVIWQSDLVEVSGESGGKGGGGSTTYSYFANFAVLVAEGPVGGFGRVWAGPEKRLIWDGATLEGGGSIRFYTGTETQNPDPLIEAYLGVGNVPAYRGYAYVVLENFPVEKDGNRIPFLTVEVGNITNESVDLGLAWSDRTFIDTVRGRYICTYRNAGNGVVVRSLTDDSLIAHYPASDNVAGGFYDSDRNVIVYANASGTAWALDLDTGANTSFSTGPHGGSGATDPGSYVIGGCYKDGLYVFVCKPNPILVPSQRVTITSVNPDTLLAVSTYTGDAGTSETIVAPVITVTNGDGYICAFKNSGEIRKYPLNTANFSSSSAGVAATPRSAGYVRADLDANTGLIWSAQISGTTVSLYVNNPVTAASVHTASITVPSGSALADGVHPFVFPPGYVGVMMEAPFAKDYYIKLDAATFANLDQGYGKYHGTGYFSFAWWNATRSRTYVTRAHTSIDYAIGTDWANFTLWGIDLGEEVGTSITPSGEPLSDIVADLCARAGLSASEYNVAALTDTVDGYALAQQTSVRGAIAALQPAFYFDGVESNGVVKFVKRGGAVAVTIPDADLGASVSGSESETDLIETVRQMEDELPRTLTVSYMQDATRYTNATRYARRLIGGSGDEQRLDLPIVMSDTKAQEVADTNLHHAWVRRKSYRFTLPRAYSYLEPTDIVSIRGQTMFLARVTQDDGVLKCEGFFDDFNYVPNVVVTETPNVVESVYLPSDTVLELM